MSVFRIHFKLIFNDRRIWIWGTAFGLIVSVMAGVVVFNIHYQDKLYQNIFIDELNVGGLTQAEALQKLHRKPQPQIKPIGEVILQANNPDQEIETANIAYEQLVIGKDYQQALKQAFTIGRTGHHLHRLLTIIELLKTPQNIQANYAFNQPLITLTTHELARVIDDEGEPFAISLATSNNPHSLVLKPGQNGQIRLVDETVKYVLQRLDEVFNDHTTRTLEEIVIDTKLATLVNTLSDTEQEQSLERARALVGTKLEFYGYDFELENLEVTADENSTENQADDATTPPKNWTVKKTINDQQLIELLTWPWGIKLNEIETLVAEWAQEIDRSASNAELEYDAATKKVTKFVPDQPGLELNQSKTRQEIVKIIEDWDKTIMQMASDETQAEVTETTKLEQTEKIVILELKQTQPEISLAETNNLGINELIGFGDSLYYGSIAPRLHNIKVASEKLNLTLIAPGEAFYFNQAVGEVTGDTGFQHAYVIRSGATILEFGGGVCQVSTTTFRAMLDAGVNITRRLPHSYRVSYYEYGSKPGFDATVYSGNVDLRFVNDTPGHILITAEADSSTAYMTVKFYGTDDGRKTEIKNYKQWGYAAPPAAQEIPDPSLAPGQRRRVENAIPGLKTSFDWVVTDAQGNVMHEKTFVSNYQAWGEKWLVGI